MCRRWAFDWESAEVEEVVQADVSGVQRVQAFCEVGWPLSGPGHDGGSRPVNGGRQDRGALHNVNVLAMVGLGGVCIACES
jgi:hypothetical protein